MQIVQTARQMGKTHAMLKWLADNPDGILYTSSVRESDRLNNEYPELAGRIFSTQNSRLRGRGRTGPVAVDNADIILREMFGNVKIIALGDD